jgi:predicted RNase H-like HicB family nuclease
MTYTVVIEYDPKAKTYGGWSPDAPDVFSVGESEEDALARFENALRGHLAFRAERGLPVPVPGHTIRTITV